MSGSEPRSPPPLWARFCAVGVSVCHVGMLDHYTTLGLIVESYYTRCIHKGETFATLWRRICCCWVGKQTRQPITWSSKTVGPLLVTENDRGRFRTGKYDRFQQNGLAVRKRKHTTYVPGGGLSGWTTELVNHWLLDKPQQILRDYSYYVYQTSTTEYNIPPQGRSDIASYGQMHDEIRQFQLLR